MESSPEEARVARRGEDAATQTRAPEAAEAVDDEAVDNGAAVNREDGPKAARKAERLAQKTAARAEAEAARAANAALKEERVATKSAAEDARAARAARKAEEAAARSTAKQEAEEARARRTSETTARLATKMALSDARASRDAAERERLTGELATLRSSYYLSGAAKKIDVRELDGFGEVARMIVSERRTGMNYDRLYTLWQAARAMPTDSAVAEVGSYQGGSAKLLAETLRERGRPPRFYVCDTFAGHAHTDAELDPAHHAARKFQDTSAEEVGEYLREYPNVELVVGDIRQTSERLAEETYGLVHIDVDVHSATDFCLRFFAPRLTVGSVIVVDDYGFLTCPGARKAVDDFIAEMPAFRLFHLLSGQAILFRC